MDERQMSERNAVAAEMHQNGLEEFKKNKWEVTEEADVPFTELSEDIKRYLYVLADWHIAKTTVLREVIRKLKAWPKFHTEGCSVTETNICNCGLNNLMRQASGI